MVLKISSGSPFETRIGYSRAVVDGSMVYVSGTTGYDYKTMQMPEDAGQQARAPADGGRGCGDHAVRISALRGPGLAPAPRTGYWPP